jgi:hypothetical protein
VAETCRRLNKKEKLKFALKTVYFSVYEVHINATGCLNIIQTSIRPGKLSERISKFQLKRVYELRQYNMNRIRMLKSNKSKETRETAMVTHPKQIRRDNLNIVRREASIHFRNRTKDYLNGKINELEQKKENTRDLYRSINEFVNG